ncbi:AMP-dependent synthetase [Burkholderia sp. HI2714]|uniref:phenylacetate--CoA ligase family protein n=1 Tax=Burkholderia sp. HI2714 TaxID=2015359 RepID=UPI000B79B586|nr:AMP-binding protein [Burkholderia sp. HI2714]OXJ31075.1 AMP-dependent synthetase [Burkholderia sp. HI2714]
MHDITDRIITLSSLFDALRKQTDWRRQLTPRQVGEITALFDPVALKQAVWRGLGNLHALPWIYHADRNDVTELRPRGVVTITGYSLQAQWRGVLLAWLTGNRVAVESEFVSFWEAVAEVAAQQRTFLPFVFSLNPEPDDGSLRVEVPPLHLPDDGNAEDPGAIRYRIGPGTAVPYPLELDLSHSWSAVLVEKTYLAGTSLTDARRQASTASRSLRLDSRVRFLFHEIRQLPYYRGLTLPDTISTFGDFPVLDKATLEAHSPPYGNGMGSGALPTGEVLVSGSSGGKKRYIPYSRHDWQSMLQEAVQMLYDSGLTPGDKVVNTLYGGHLYGGMLTSSQELALMPVESYTVGQNVTPEELVHLRQAFGINVVIGIPSLLETLLDGAKRIDPAFRIEKVIYGGAAWQESRKRWLKTEFGVSVVRSILAANDGAQIGYQPEDLGGTVHLLVDDYNYVEIVDDDGKPVPDGQQGHILITNWQKFEYPLVRYRIGDLGRIVAHSQGRALEYLGRGDGLIILNGRQALYHQEIVDALAHVPIIQLQLSIRRQRQYETLQVNVESPEHLDTRGLTKHLIDTLPALQSYDMVSDQLLQFEVEVVQLAQGTLTRNPVSGKVRLVEDHRQSDLETAS